MGQLRRGQSAAVRIARALGGLVVLVALLAGVPLALFLLAGSPIPESAPTLDQITALATSRDLDGSLFRTTVAYLGWLGWSSFALGVLLETVSLVAGFRMPKIRGLRAQQRAAAALIGLVLTGVAGPGTVAVADTGSGEAVTTPSVAAADDLGNRYASAPEAQPDTPYTVQHGDTLWDIAEDHLESPASDAEIAAEWPRWYDANREVIGDDPDLILPGQRLAHPDAGPAPTGAQGSGGTPSGDDAEPPSEPDDESEQPGDPASVPEAGPAPPNDRLVAPSAAPEGTPLPVLPDVTATPTPAAASGAAENGAVSQGVPARTVAGIGALLAAALTALIALGRRAERRRGQEFPAPNERAASTEQDLWNIADPVGAQLLDRALRDLAASVDPLPPVRAVRLTPHAVELYLTTPVQLPHPWQGKADSTVWTLPADLMQHIERTDANVAAPYPCLVTTGHDEEGGHVLVDLEQITALGIDGPREQAQQIITALAIELACSPLADDLSVSVIGCCHEIGDVLGTGRLQYVEQLDDLLDTLEVHVHGRTSADVLIIADPLTDVQRHRLAQLIHVDPRPAVAAITTGSDGLTDWFLRYADGSPPEAWVLEPADLDVQPQRITSADYDDIVEILRAAGHTNDHYQH